MQKLLKKYLPITFNLTLIIKKYKKNILINICALVIGIFLSSVFFLLQNDKVVVVDLDRILKSKNKEYSKIMDEEKREKKLNQLESNLKKILPQLGSNLVINKFSIFYMNKNAKITDKTNFVMKKLH